MKYKVWITVKGYLEMEAESEEGCREKFDVGYHMTDLIFNHDEIDEIEQIGKG